MPQRKQPSKKPFSPDWQLKALIARHRYGNKVTRDVTHLLTEFYRGLQAEIAGGKIIANWQRDQLQPLVQWSRERLQEVVPKAKQRLHEALMGQAQAEQLSLNLQANDLRHVMGLPSRAVLLQTARFPTIINELNVGGTRLGEWWDREAVGILSRVQTTTQRELLKGKNPRDVSRYAISSDPKLMTMDRASKNAVRAAVYTAMTGVQSAAANFEFDEMQDVIDDIMLEAVLDGRTTIVCRGLDGTRWKVKDPKRPRPPFHVRCRTAEVPVVDLTVLGLPPDDLGARVSMDEWFRAQPEKDQNEMLGPTRAQWFRDGRIDLAGLINSDPRAYTLAELRAQLGVPSPARPSIVIPPTANMRDQATYLSDVRRAMASASQAQKAKVTAAQQAFDAKQAEARALTNRLHDPNLSAADRAQVIADTRQALTDYQLLQAELIAAQNTARNATRTAVVDEVRSTLDEDVASKGTAFQGAMLNPTLDPKMRGQKRKRYQAELDEATVFWDRLFPSLPGERTAVPFVQSVTRNRSGALKGVLYMSPRSKAKVYVHELAHAFEYHAPTAGQFGVWFRGKRQTGLPHRLPGYQRDEFFYSGRFVTPYMGKTYDAHVTYFGALHSEVLSLGLEMMFEDPEALERADPELFDDLLDFIRNWRTWTP
ncbi:MAG: minor capsid protein [Gemmatimonas sp.]